MRILLHIGLEQVGADIFQKALGQKRNRLMEHGVLVPHRLGAHNHTKLYMAITDPDHVDPLRFGRGYAEPAAQQALYDAVVADLERELQGRSPKTLLLTASQLGPSLHRRSELERLRGLLTAFSDDIQIVAHVDEPARLLARYYAHQVFNGRALTLEAELEMLGRGAWWDACLAQMPRINAHAGQFEETQGQPFWLDYSQLTAFWEQAFGAGSVRLRAYSQDRFNQDNLGREIVELLGLETGLGKLEPAASPDVPSAAWIARARQMNRLFLQILRQGDYKIPRKTWRDCLHAIAIDGDVIDPGDLAAISRHFEPANAQLRARFSDLATCLTPPPPTGRSWSEADAKYGYRPTQYLLALMHRIKSANKSEATSLSPKSKTLSPTASKVLSPQAMDILDRLRQSPFAPHNKIGRAPEDAPLPPYAPLSPDRFKPKGGNVIVGCMKNEAPYIVEWVAYHRAIGVDNFLIYTNGCSDGTDAILDRLQDLGYVQHRNNDQWKGKSPQQHALNRSLKEPVIKNADWIIHIDVDEFMNIRCGNGTLDDLFAAAPDATNFAVTWRLFGHNGVTRLADEFVIDQFDRCAPKFCPKPHTVWGFKTMFRNINAYQKISCHRPNKLRNSHRTRVKWVNGSGQDMTSEAIDNGWRNSRATIGYDLVQLNHYALRSAESFLIKRQRGRALHVDRSIGLNYWIRMDWCDHRDLTIKRNLPRLRAEYDRIMQDPALSQLHAKGLAWHRAKADELHNSPEFQELYEQALTLQLNADERAAFALTLDLES